MPISPILPLAAAAVAAYFLLKDDDEDKGDEGLPAQGAPPPMLPPPILAPAPLPRAPSPVPSATAPSAILVAAAQRLASIAAAPGAPCDQVAQATFAFQQRAASEGRHLRTIDGKYGAETRGLLASILQGSVPAALWPGRCGSFKPVPSAAPPPGLPPAPGGMPTRVADTPLAAMQQLIDQGDAAGDDYNKAVTLYKVAGMYGVTNVGPAIDRQTGDRSKGATHAIWQVDNAHLQSVPSVSATASLSQSVLHAGTPVFVWPAIDKALHALHVGGRRSTIADAMTAQSLVRGMYQKYASLIAQFPAVAGIGVGSVGWVGGGYWTGTDLQNPELLHMKTQIDLGESAFASGRYDEAMLHYKAAGQIGASMGHGIDVRTGGTRQPLTQSARALSGRLARMPMPSSMGARAAGVARTAGHLANDMADQCTDALTSSRPMATTGIWYTGQLLPGQSKQLLDRMSTMLGAGDAAMQRSLDDAVEGFKMAARQGAQWVAPAIDIEMPGKGLTTRAGAMYARIANIVTAAMGRAVPKADADLAQATAHEMFTMLSKALGGDSTGYSPFGYATGIGTVIPSMYHARECLDARSDPQLCAAVASALASETNVQNLQSLVAQLTSRGFLQAALAVTQKAASLGAAS
jgi:hypothetical protein